MIVEVYAAPNTGTGEPTESPISNPTGELPEQEPALSPDQLMGSFDSRDEAITFIKQQILDSGLNVVATQSGNFSDYTHIDWLTIQTTDDNRSTPKTYYLVTDEGY